ncbi:MAG: ankyrin repeat domain-containing protein [Erysipelotrichaceae bacterium]|nr:ankyrin repeat domain-containing protein [Erysipelotrichaceae bacterium]
MSVYYICIDNFNIEPIDYKIHFKWTDEFIDKRINNESFRDRFYEFEKDFLHSDELAIRGCYINLETEIENSTIKSIKYGKYRDLVYGHGRPATADLKLTKKEIKAISEFYASVTYDNTQEQYNSLINVLENKKELLDGFQYVKATSKGITVKDREGNKTVVNRKYIIDALAISHKYIDVLNDRKILESNLDYFDQAIIDPLLAILSCVDYSSYQNKDTLIRQANNRKIGESAEKGYEELLKAVRENNIEKTKDLAKYSAIVKSGEKDDDTPLNIAIRKNNAEIVKILVNNGACIFHNSSYEKGCPAIKAAIEERNYECQRILSEILINYNGDITWNFISSIYGALYKCNDFESIKTVFPSTIGKYKKYIFKASLFTTAFSSEELRYFASLDNASIIWDLRNIEVAYKTNKDLAMKLVSQGCDDDVVDFFIEEDDYELFESSIKHHTYSPKGREDTATKIFEKDERWYKTAKRYADIQQFHRFEYSYLEQVYRDDKSRFFEIVKEFNISEYTINNVLNNKNF